MYVQQLYTNCLAQAAYYVESNGEVLIIDPLRDPGPYLDLAKKRKAKIRYVFETHFHADFVSGHLELSRKTGATIIFGPNANPKYKAFIAKDLEPFELGKTKFQVLHTPGHTIESSCVLLFNEEGKPHCIFTGDTLFAGDVGRPDLLSGNLNKEELAGMLFESLKKIKALPDDLLVYPGHGAGSACGKNIGKETVTTIGIQKRRNYALGNLSKNEFIKTVTTGLPNPPAYFFKDASINISGYDSYDAIMSKELIALHLDPFKTEVKDGAIILDTRNAADFARGFIPGSINVGLNGDFAVWAGTMIAFGTPLVIVAEKGKERESIVRLARIGFDTIKGYLNGGFEIWSANGEPVDFVKEIEMKDLKQLHTKDTIILDVRRNDEHEKGAIPNALHVPLDFLHNHMSELNKDKNYVVYCAGGYRSMIAVSILKKYGIKHIQNLKNGINAYSKPKLAKS